MSDGAKDSASKAVGNSSGAPQPTASQQTPTVAASPPASSNSNGAVKTVSQMSTQVAAMSPSSSGSQSANSAVTDPATQFRSTLALGQLITAKTPSAGSRIIAGELRQLSNTLKQEGAALRKEISTLHTRLADSLKVVLEEDREQRNASGPGAMARRPVQFGSFPYRRFPVYRIPRRVSLAFARKSVTGASSPPRGNASGAGISNPTAAAAAVAAAMKSAAAAIAADASALSPASSPENNNTSGRVHDVTTKDIAGKSTPSTPAASGRQNQSTQTRAMKSPHGTPSRSGTVFKNPWFSRDRSSSSYDGEADTDSDEE